MSYRGGGGRGDRRNAMMAGGGGSNRGGRDGNRSWVNRNPERRDEIPGKHNRKSMDGPDRRVKGSDGEPKTIIFGGAKEDWDASMASTPAEKRKAVPVGDTIFQSRLNFGNVFKSCVHETVRAVCPCTHQNEFIVCTKCFTVFCDSQCLKENPGIKPKPMNMANMPGAQPIDYEDENWLGIRDPDSSSESGDIRGAAAPIPTTEKDEQPLNIVAPKQKPLVESTQTQQPNKYIGRGRRSGDIQEAKTGKDNVEPPISEEASNISNERGIPIGRGRGRGIVKRDMPSLNSSNDPPRPLNPSMFPSQELNVAESEDVETSISEESRPSLAADKYSEEGDEEPISYSTPALPKPTRAELKQSPQAPLLPNKTNYTFSMDSFAIQPELCTAVGFPVTLTNCEPLDTLYVLPANSRFLLIDLSDQIVQQVENDDAKFSPDFKFHPDMVILAKDVSTKGNLAVKGGSQGQKGYHRCCVKKVNLGSNSLIEVEDLDRGGTFLAAEKDCRHFSYELTLVGPLAYKVKVPGINTKAPLMLSSDFELFVRSKLDISYKLEKIHEDGSVSLRDSSTHLLLEDEIKKVEVWNWEQFSNKGMSSDNEICDLSIFDKIHESFMEMPSEMEIDVLVHTIGEERVPLNPSLPIEYVLKKYMVPYLVVEPLHEAAFEFREVLKNQINHYMSQIKPSKFFPTKDDLFLLYAPEGETGGGEWHRCVQLFQQNSTYMCVDTGVRYCLPVKAMEKFKFRRMCGEFKRIPRLLLMTEFKNLKWDEGSDFGLRMKAEFHEVFQVGKVVQLSFLSASDGVQPVAHVHSKELETKLEKMMVSDES